MTKLFETSLALIMLLSIYSCNANPTLKSSGNTQNTDSSLLNNHNYSEATKERDDMNKIDSLINDKIASLPEFKELLKYNDRDGNVSIFILKRPQSDFKYYWVQVGRNHPERFEPVYNFYILTESFDILFYDTYADSTLTLKQWRANR